MQRAKEDNPMIMERLVVDDPLTDKDIGCIKGRNHPQPNRLRSIELLRRPKQRKEEGASSIPLILSVDTKWFKRVIRVVRRRKCTIHVVARVPPEWLRDRLETQHSNRLAPKWLRAL